MTDGLSFVYFISSAEGFLKIGCSKNPVQRFGGHKNTLRKLGELTFIGAVEGKLKDEMYALNRFRRLRYMPTRFEVRKLPENFSIKSLFSDRKIWSFDELKERERNQRLKAPRRSYQLTALLSKALLNEMAKFTKARGIIPNLFLESAIRNEIQRWKKDQKEIA